MAPKRKYKRGRRAFSFKAASEGLRAGERRIAEQSKIQINALKEQQLQQANIDKLQIKGHADKAAFEEGVQKSKFQLNEMSRDLIVENMNIRADRDVDRLRGIANEYEKKAKHLAQLAPKQAKAYADVIKGVGEFTEALEYQQLLKDYDKNKGVSYQNSEQLKLEANLLKESFTNKKRNYEEAKAKTLELGEELTQENLIKNGLLPDSERHELFRQTFGRSNDARGNEVKAHWRDNKRGEVAQVRQFILGPDVKGTISKHNVKEWYEWGAINYLKRFNISPASKAGREIMAEWESLAELEATRLTNKDNSKYTLDQMSTFAKQLRETPLTNTEKRQLIFNEGVFATDVGTFENERTGKFRVGINNVGDSAQEFFEFYVKRYRQDFNSEKEIREFLAPFIILDRNSAEKFETGTYEDKTLGTTFGERHPLRVDEIVGAWSEAQKIDSAARTASKTSEDTSNIAASEARYKTHLANKERGTDDNNQPYEMTDKQFWLTEIDLATNHTDGTNASRDVIFKKAAQFLQFDRSQWTVADKFTTIKRLELDGDHEGALLEYMQATAAERDKLRPSFERYQKIYESGWSYGTNATKGIKGFTLKGEATFKAAEKSNKGNFQLSDSAKGMIPIMVTRVEEKVASIIDDPNYKGTVEQAIQLAWQEELIEFQKGENKTEPDKYGEGFYARKRQYYTEGAGSLPWFVYEHNDVSASDSDQRSFLNQLRARTTDGSLKNAVEARNIRIEGVHSAETVRLLTKFGRVSYEEWIKDDSLVSPHKITTLAEVAANLADGKISILDGAQLNAAVPENLRILAHLTGRTDVEVVNDLLEHHGHKVRFMPNAQDAARIKANGVLVQKRNVQGLDNFFGARAQNITPMLPWIRMSTEEGITASESFMKSIGVESYYNESGDLKVTDYEKFFNNNGLSKADVNWEQIAPTFGLTGIANIKKLEYERDILKRLVKSKPIKNK